MPGQRWPYISAAHSVHEQAHAVLVIAERTVHPSWMNRQRMPFMIDLHLVTVCAGAPISDWRLFTTQQAYPIRLTRAGPAVALAAG